MSSGRQKPLVHSTAPRSLFVGGTEAATGSTPLVTATDAEIQITAPVDFGVQDVSIELTKDPAWVAVDQCRALERLGRPESKVALQRASLLFTSEPGGAARDLEAASPSGFDELTLEQRAAVIKAFENDVTFLWGPPGTGKTKTIAAAVETAVRKGLSVLFVGPTKVAVDQALLKVCHRLEEFPQFPNGLVQRRGDMELAELQEKYGSSISPGELQARFPHVLAAEIARLEGEIEDLRNAGHEPSDMR